MNSNQSSNPSQNTAPVLVASSSESLSELERFAAAYVRFDALMTAQLQELEFRFRDFWTPQVKRKEMLGRR
jgi:hypothetical protein